jgi:AcrR family transcriptional regulator
MLEAAAEVFGEHGYHGASMDEIAARAGITKPMLYRYFGSKEGVFTACGEAAVAVLRERVREASGRRDLPPDVRLWRGLVGVFGFIGEHRDLWFVFNPPGGGPAPSPAGEVGARGREAMTALMRETFVAAAAGEGVADDAAAQAATLGDALTGAVLATAEGWLRHPDEPADLQALRVMNLVWVGFEQMLEGRLWLPPE